jgi:bifunctional UDP-N-acetylglucosamine pyrophosphorylase / glucosamine-1-phosphate N-acetyltransferase
MSIKIIILAAGQGTRMQSSQPKVLHTLAGEAMLIRILNTCKKIKESEIFVVGGYQFEALKKAVEPSYGVHWLYQEKQLGTAHAVGLATSLIQESDQVIVLAGDVPLITDKTLTHLLTLCTPKQMAMVTQHLKDPAGYGRIKRDQKNNICGIVEHKDASADELEITEINTGIMAIPGKFLLKALPEIKNNNAQKEFYLTDIIELAVKHGLTVKSLHAKHEFEVKGVNSKKQLADLEREYQRFLADQFMAQQGVSFADPNRVDFRGSSTFQEDVQVDVNVIFEGINTIGKRCRIGASCILKNVTLGDDVVIEAMSLLENASVENKASIGPFARLRPGSEIKQGAKIGNFVEVKNSVLGKNSKANHLSYIGDASIGEEVNIGAGTITCNYDGVNKYETIIEDYAFIGSNTSLIAPVTIGKGSNIGAGSAINQDTPAHKLTLARAKQLVIDKWQRPEKKNK